MNVVSCFCRTSGWLLAATILVAMLTGQVSSTARAQEPQGSDVATGSLAKFSAEGIKIGTPLADFKKKFSTAKLSEDPNDKRMGLDCYKLEKPKDADTVRFYFFDGNVYQIELVYQAPRVQSLGGVEGMVRRYAREFGAVDYVDTSRRSWNRPASGRRADFFTGPTSSTLAITDSSMTPAVERRAREALK